MKKFEVTILGCGSALPTIKNNQTSQIVNIREKLFMIDCGEGTQLQFRKARLKFTRLQRIFISHLHGDHCFGLMGLFSTFGLLGRTADLHIHSPKGLEQLLRPALDHFCSNIPYKLFFHEFDTRKSEVIHEDRSLTVETIPLIHRIPSAGFLFKEKPGLNTILPEQTSKYNVPVYEMNRLKAGFDFTTEDGIVIPNELLTKPAALPRSYAYCSDTLYNPNLVNQIKGVNLLFHEATFANTEKIRAKQTFHSTAEDAANIALQAEAKQLLIGHFSARYRNKEVLLDEAKALFPDTLLAIELETYSVV